MMETFFVWQWVCLKVNNQHRWGYKQILWGYDSDIMGYNQQEYKWVCLKMR
jgi:hypothetical protein